jgi:dihydrofolate synthase/folylpolyglutamate synthase
VQTKTYSSAIEWLFQQFPSYQAIGAAAYKPDLGNILELLEALKLDYTSLKFVHIAGTNGKGSTSSMLASILTESNEKVGLFTSPHIQSFTERIRVNGSMISEDAVVDFTSKIHALKLTIEPSFFEITFAMALAYFIKEECTICVIETGLGGRLDATNCISPLVTAITSISLDHTQFLGNTLRSIAFEKAGIFKHKTPAIIGNVPSETLSVFEMQAKTKKAPFIRVKNRVHTFAIPLLGSYQAQNFQLVLTVIDTLKKIGFTISDANIQLGLDNLYKNTGFYGRMQVIGQRPLTILDVSHNVEGVEQTLSSLKELNKGQLYLIYGSSSDKNYEEIIALFPKDATVHFCQFASDRSLSAAILQDLATKQSTNSRFFTNIHSAINSIQQAAEEEDTILVLGSFFLVSDYF